MRKTPFALLMLALLTSCKEFRLPLSWGQASDETGIQSGRNFHIDAAEEASLAEQHGVPVPIPADAASIFASEPSAWRGEDYEIYRLNLGSNIIVLKFASYAAQRAFFFRLTYFANMDASARHVEAASFYEGMHSYNANDYGGSDLAEYFNLLAKQDMQPEPGEAKLLDMALAYGLISQKGTKYSGRAGAIISFSLETEKGQRKRYLTHETMHGLFYTIPALREDIYRVVEGLSKDELRFWNLFLEHKGELDSRAGLAGYNIDDRFLFVNEIFAHTMQGGYEAVEDYFWGTYVPRMKKLLPETAGFLSELSSRKHDMFGKLFLQFATLLKKHCGLEKGALF